MMVIDYCIRLESLTGEMLDKYLSKGYYRMVQSIFTTDVVIDINSSYPVFWLRVNVDLLNIDTLTKKTNKSLANYTIIIQDACINDEIEQLYATYKSNINFDTYDTVSTCLFGESDRNIFDTKMIQLRHNEKLIAVGYFDCGSISLMGIINFYNHDYKQHGLGKYLMLLKINYALQQGIKYYYPGYFSSRNSKFDYKIFPDRKAVEVYRRSKDEWVNYTSVTRNELDEDFWSNFLINDYES